MASASQEESASSLSRGAPHVGNDHQCVVYVTSSLPDPGTQPLEAAGLAIRQHNEPSSPSPHELSSGLQDACAALTTVADTVTIEMLEAAKRLRVVANIAVGYDNVDLAAADRLGIVVTHTPEVLTEAVADLAWALLLAAARRVTEGDTWVRSGDWPGWAPTQLLGYSLVNKTLAVVGMGRIGSAVARRAVGFNMRILSCSRTSKPELEKSVGATHTSLDAALRQADYVVVTAPLSSESFHLIDSTALSIMKETAILINVGRGSVVNEEALVDALREGAIAGAGLDVYENEPTVPAELRSLRNVVLLPHIGSATHETRAAMVELCCQNILAVLSGGRPLTPVPFQEAPRKSHA